MATYTNYYTNRSATLIFSGTLEATYARHAQSYVDGAGSGKTLEVLAVVAGSTAPNGISVIGSSEVTLFGSTIYLYTTIEYTGPGAYNLWYDEGTRLKQVSECTHTVKAIALTGSGVLNPYFSTALEVTLATLTSCDIDEYFDTGPYWDSPNGVEYDEWTINETTPWDITYEVEEVATEDLNKLNVEFWNTFKRQSNIQIRIGSNSVTIPASSLGTGPLIYDQGGSVSTTIHAAAHDKQAYTQTATLLRGNTSAQSTLSSTTATTSSSGGGANTTKASITATGVQSVVETLHNIGADPFSNIPFFTESRAFARKSITQGNNTLQVSPRVYWQDGEGISGLDFVALSGESRELAFSGDLSSTLSNEEISLSCITSIYEVETEVFSDIVAATVTLPSPIMSCNIADGSAVTLQRPVGPEWRQLNYLYPTGPVDAAYISHISTNNLVTFDASGDWSQPDNGIFQSSDNVQVEMVSGASMDLSWTGAAFNTSGFRYMVFGWSSDDTDAYANVVLNGIGTWTGVRQGEIIDLISAEVPSSFGPSATPPTWLTSIDQIDVTVYQLSGEATTFEQLYGFYFGSITAHNAPICMGYKSSTIVGRLLVDSLPTYVINYNKTIPTLWEAPVEVFGVDGLAGTMYVGAKQTQGDIAYTYVGSHTWNFYENEDFWALDLFKTQHLVPGSNLSVLPLQIRKAYTSMQIKNPMDFGNGTGALGYNSTNILPLEHRLGWLLCGFAGWNTQGTSVEITDLVDSDRNQNLDSTGGKFVSHGLTVGTTQVGSAVIAVNNRITSTAYGEETIEASDPIASIIAYGVGEKAPTDPPPSPPSPPPPPVDPEIPSPPAAPSGGTGLPDLPDIYVPDPWAPTLPTGFEPPQSTISADDLLLRKWVTSSSYALRVAEDYVDTSVNNSLPSTFELETDSYLWFARIPVSTSVTSTILLTVSSITYSIRRATSYADFFSSYDAVWVPGAFLQDTKNDPYDTYVYLRNLEVQSFTTTASGAPITISEVPSSIHPDTPVWYTVFSPWYENLPKNFKVQKFPARNLVWSTTSVTADLPTSGATTVFYRSWERLASILSTSGQIQLGLELAPVEFQTIPNALDSFASPFGIERIEYESNRNLLQRLFFANNIDRGSFGKTLSSAIALDLGLVTLRTWDGVSTFDAISSGITGVIDIAISTLPEYQTISDELLTYSGSGGVYYSSKREWENNYLLFADGIHVTTYNYPNLVVSGGTISFGTTLNAEVKAQYKYKNYTKTASDGYLSTVIPTSANVASGLYYVACLHDITTWSPANKKDFEARKDTEIMHVISNNIKESLPLIVGTASWGDRPTHWFTDEEIKPELTYLPVVFD